MTLATASKNIDLLRQEINERYKTGNLTTLFVLTLTIRLLLVLIILVLWVCLDCLFIPFRLMFGEALNLLIPKDFEQKTNNIND